MKLAFYIARRYLISKKSANIINIISMISVAGVTIGTMALIVVLSAFNGIDSFIGQMLSSFDPDIKIEAAEGKSFSLNEADFSSVRKLEGVIGFTEVVEDNALLRYSNRQRYATVKGVDDSYPTVSGLDSTLIDGKLILKNDLRDFAVLGHGIAYDLSVGLSFVDPIHFFVPKKKQKTRINMEQAFNHNYLFPSGIFSVQQEVDSKYILVPIEFARELFELDGLVTSVELRLEKGQDIALIKKEITQLLGNRFVVKDRYEQHELLYRVMKSEKWSSFLILSFILVIASFNLLGSLTMIIIDKKDDIRILQSMGANKKLIRRIFLFEGWLVSVSGAVIGLIMGIVLVWAQMRFALVKLPGDGSFALSAYPVELKLTDVLATFIIVLSIGFLASWYPVKSLKANYY